MIIPFRKCWIATKDRVNLLTIGGRFTSLETNHVSYVTGGPIRTWIVTLPKTTILFYISRCFVGICDLV